MGARAWAWWLALLARLAGARELDPGACAARFDVQRDKIIRTEESREMGARYLSELDVGARAECLRLCCETDACDVFVYEEKGPGSCYLFNCGPPEDFRCKFTAHSNFSSGVLALSRRLAELQDQERLAHHEQELANLRAVTSSTASTRAASTAPPPRTAAPATERPPTAASRCSRYQFACRRGGECIAVYNACDGVPQCADGSDEAPELGCPPPPAPPTTTTTTAAPQLLKPMQESIEGVASVEGMGPERWPHRLTQAQPQHRYTGEAGASSHIFSHKGGLLQEPDAGAQFPPFEPWPRRAWPQQQPPNGMEGMSGMSGERGWGGYPRVEWPEPDPRRAWAVPPRPEQEMPVYIPPKTMPEVPVVYSSQQQTLRDSPKKGFELLKDATEPPPPEPKPTAQDNTTNNKHAKEKSPGAASKPAAAALAPAALAPAALAPAALAPVALAPAALAPAPAAQPRAATQREREGLSERPPAAMMLLLIGLTLCAGMAGMLACRLRSARLRLRRGKSPFAHDADYLVNGMYL